jgi:uncharacterized protein (DUF58 family)
MNGALPLVLIIYTLLLAALLTLRGELLALLIPPALYLLAGYLRGPEEIRLEVSRELSTERALPGMDVQVSTTIRNRGGILEEVLLEDVLPEGLILNEGSARSLTTLPPGGTHILRYTVSGPRGGYGFEGLVVRASDQLGIAGRKAKVPAASRLWIFPPVTRVRQVTIRPRRTRVYAGSIPARVGGSGVEFFGVRAYQPGDSSRLINWRVSARHAEDLFTNEFQQERVSDVGIIVDGRVRTNSQSGGRSLFEYSVQAAASLSGAFLEQGNRVGLLLYSNFLAWTYPAYGRLQRERILQALAGARPGESEVFSVFEHIPTRLFPAGSQIVIISPLVEDDLVPLVRLRALGYQVMVVSPDPVSFELAHLPASREVGLASSIINMERGLLLQRLRRAGVQTLDWNVEHPFDLVLRQGLGRPPGWLEAIGS